ncbi:MAG TPA: hypothetical protein VIX17_17885 [Pyrinomonadaceae bacterium]
MKILSLIFLGLSLQIVQAPTMLAQQSAITKLSFEQIGSVASIPKRIAFISDIGGASSLYVVDPEHSDIDLLGKLHVEGVRVPAHDLVFSPDKKQVIFLSTKLGSGAALWISSTDGSNARKLIDWKWLIYGPFQASWSPTGDRFAFVIRKENSSAVYTMNVDGSGFHFVATGDRFSWSPDGHQIALTTYIPEKQGRYLEVVDIEGTNLRLISSAGRASECVWSPDGKQIAFMESRRETTVEPKYDVSVVRPSGQEKQTVIENVPLYSHLSWSPDSRFLSFVSNFEGSRGLYTWATHDASGKRFRFLSGVEAPFAWSPDSKRVAYGENIIRVVDITTEKTRILFHTSGFGGPLWLPDGNRVLMYNTLSTRRIDSDDVNLYVTRIEPQYISRLTAENLQVWDISSPPNGKVIAFTASAKGNNAASSRVYVINSDGSNERELAVPSIEPGWFAWSADGNKIAFVKEMLNCKKCRPGNLKIEVANADGSDEHTIVNQPAWNFAPAWLPDGKSVVFLSDRNNAHGVYLTDIKSKHTQLLADVSGSIPNHVRIERTDKFVPLVWSPDATKLATSSAVPRPGLIQVIDVKKPATFTFSGIAPWVLNWTPDSSRIAVADLVHGIAMNSITPTFVDLLAFDGSNRLRLMAPSTLSGALFRMAWSIDGKRFACSGITIFNADGSNQRFVVKGWNPVWVR